MTRKPLWICLGILVFGISGIGIHTCCADPAVLQGPICTVAPSSAVACAGGSVVFCASVAEGTPPYTYCWQQAPYVNPCISTAACLMLADVTADDAGTYRVVVTDDVGDSTVCYADLVVSSPTCTVDPSSYEVCEGGYATFCATAMGGSPPYTYLWNTGETTTCITTSTPGTYEVTVTDAMGCWTTCSGALIVYPNPNCVITGPDHICEGESTVLCTTEGMVMYMWTGPYGFMADTRCIEVGSDLAPGIYTYEVTVANFDGCESWCSMELFVEDCAGLPGVREIPATFALRQPEPNPFGGTTLITFDMPVPGPVTVRVFDVNGRIVKTLIDDEQPAGRHYVTWQGDDEAGDYIGSGTYVVQFRAGGFTETRKLTVLR